MYSVCRQVLKKHEPVYQAVWANNTDFDEVLISPVMIQDHMPDNVLQALNKHGEVLKETGLAGTVESLCLVSPRAVSVLHRHSRCFARFQEGSSMQGSLR
uniref:Uncharacterized protein n=1 Tax=Timema poppense TaxID=170557 RepID=A0A7R9DCA7_TIMPO|nr:unnamed protein product [Timema poppensis]